MEADRRTRRAWFLAVTTLALLVPARVGTLVAAVGNDPGLADHDLVLGLLVIAALFALHLALVLPRSGNRQAWPVLVGMAALTFGPYAVLGRHWGPVAGLLAASVALRLRGPAAPAGFALVAVGDAVLALLLFPEMDVSGKLSRLAINASFGLVVYGAVRLAQLVTLVDVDRRRLAHLEVERSRLQTAAALRHALGRDLRELVTRLRAIDPASTEISAVLQDVATRARRALAAARSVADIHRRSDTVVADAELTNGDTTPAKATQTSWWVMLLLVVVYGGLTLVNIVGFPGADGGTWTAACVGVVVIGTLHQVHAAPRRGGGAPAYWPWTLAAQTGAVAVTLALIGVWAIPLLALWVGAVAVLGSWPWAIVATAAASGYFVAATAAVVSSPAEHLYQVATITATAVGFHAVAQLPAVARELSRTRTEVARLAVLRDRLRLSRDVHDLLGSRLSAIALQADVMQRQLEHLPESLRDELRELADLAALALADTDSVAGTSPQLALDEELVDARTLLRTAGVDVHVDLDTLAVPPGASQALAVVVREATTNVVRHAGAARANIDGHQVGDHFVLTIRNDGARSAPRLDTDGAGLDNLASRVSALGGTLHAGLDPDGWFTLRAEVPAHPRRAWRRRRTAATKGHR